MCLATGTMLGRRAFQKQGDCEKTLSPAPREGTGARSSFNLRWFGEKGAL